MVECGSGSCILCGDSGACMWWLYVMVECGSGSCILCGDGGVW